MNQMLRRSRKIAIAVLGGIIIIVGLILVPYPGPGWLIVFAGLAVLSTEFTFAARMLERLKIKYESWKIWLKRQHKVIQLLVLAFTGLVVLGTVYLLNTFGLIDNFFHIHQDWLHSPILGK